MPKYLSNIWDAANEPLVPEAPVRRAQEAMTTPRLDESPMWAKVKGFGAGALEGLRQQTSPLNIAGMATMAIPGAGAARAATATRAARPVAAAGGAEKALAGLRNVRPAAGESLSEGLAEFVPMGGEKAFNAARGFVDDIPMPDAGEAAYYKLLNTMGRPSGVAEHSSQAIKDISHPGAQAMIEKLHNEARPAFETLKKSGAFRGERNIQ